MISTNNIGLSFGGRKLFDEVTLKFMPGNCYGLIGANGAGKSTFLKVLSGELETQIGSVSVGPEERISVLKQNQHAYDEFTVLDTVMMGNQELYKIMEEKNKIYSKENFSDEDGLKVSELETRFTELNGWEA